MKTCRLKTLGCSSCEYEACEKCGWYEDYDKVRAIYKAVKGKPPLNINSKKPLLTNQFE